jgi:hypothetical protein
MKREPRWVAVFLKQLERSGNVRMAAEGAGVDYTTAYQRRKRHGDFAEAWEGALTGHKCASDKEQTLTLPQPPAAPSLSLDGRGDVAVRPDGKVIKGSDARWGKRAEEAFLTELTVSASVRRAAAAAGFSAAAVYKRRLKDRRFALAWEAALETGRARLQAHLVEAANRTFDPDELPVGDEHEAPKVSVSEAINIAKLGSAGSGKAGKGASWPGTSDDEPFDERPITREEWEEAGKNIVHRLQRLREQMEKQERETGRCQSCGQELPAERMAALEGPEA